MKSLFKIFVLLELLISVNSIKAQYFFTGQDPASVKWQQIKTKDFQIIFPENYSKWAQYYINTFSLTSPINNSEYNSNLKRVSVILHNQTTVSNAYTPIAPSRIDIFEMQAQNTYPQKWQNQLVLHEYRHAIQQFKLRQGFTKGLYYVFGEQGVAFIMGLYLPFWFMEGDAVYAETIHSNSGRGRIPEFIYPLKAQALDKRIYKYDKAVYGSFRDFVPDHYTLGYQLMARGVESNGIGMWNNTMNLVAKRPFYILPFTISLKKETGRYKVQYYNNVMRSLKMEWWIHDKPEIDNEVEIISPQRKNYTSYLFPNALNDGSIIAEKKSIDDINRFVRIASDGTEEKVFTPGFDFYESLSVSNNKICWNERTYDPRWELRDYSVIKTYDIETGKLEKLTSKTRYFAPALSNSGNKIAVVRVSNESEYFLDFLDAETGKVLKEINTKENLFFSTPHWSNNDKYIVVIVLGKQGKSIALVNPKTSEIKFLLPFSYKEIKWPVMYEHWVVYTGTYEGKDNIYAIDINNNTIYKVFEARFGATNSGFSDDGKTLFFSYYTADGYKLAKMPFNPEKFRAIKLTETHHLYLADRLVNKNTFSLDRTKIPDSVYTAKKYSKAAHLFNLHSWAPISVDANNYTINPGITLLSQNKLSTAISSIDYTYDLNERTNNIKFSFDYHGWYPVIGFSVDYGGRRAIHQLDSVNAVHLKWNETNVSLNLTLPLIFTSGKWIKGIQPIAGINQKFRGMIQNNDTISFKETTITAPYYRFYAYNQFKRSAKDIYPKWGQSIDLIYRNTPLSDYINSQTGVTAWFYFPGILRHNGIRVYGGYQKTVAESYSFSNFVAIPRGYTDVFYPEYFTIRSDYVFPIAYPDLNVPGVFYLNRIYSKLFYDYLQGTDHNGSLKELSSVGAEVYTDWHLLSLLINFNLGVRVSHRFLDNSQFYEFLFGFNFN